MPKLPPHSRLEELRHRLRLLRIYIARLDDPTLSDLDALLSVAEAEVERVATSTGRQQSDG